MKNANLSCFKTEDSKDYGTVRILRMVAMIKTHEGYLMSTSWLIYVELSVSLLYHTSITKSPHTYLKRIAAMDKPT